MAGADDDRACPHCGLFPDAPLDEQLGVYDEDKTPVDTTIEKLARRHHANVVLLELQLETERRERLRLEGELAIARREADELRLKAEAFRSRADEYDRLKPAYDTLRLEFNRWKVRAIQLVRRRDK